MTRVGQQSAAINRRRRREGFGEARAIRVVVTLVDGDWDIYWRAEASDTALAAGAVPVVSALTWDAVIEDTVLLRAAVLVAPAAIGQWDEVSDALS